MAPDMPGWAHPYRSPFVVYADGGDDPAPEPVVAVDPEPDDEPVDDWQPPSREEYEKLVDSHRRASAEAASRRKWLKAAGYDPKTGNRIDAEPAPEPEPATPPADGQPQGLSQADVDRRVNRAVAEAKIEGMRGAKKLAASFISALSDQDWNGTRLDLIMPLADLEGVDPDDPEDLAERVGRVKELFPEGFSPVKRTRTNPAGASNPTGGSGQNGVPAAKVDTADKPAPKPEPKSWAETLAERAMRS
ncbi:hypothetical protein [Streptomyces antibioticus]|uniref:hypothetical protein n=1 Tax=Streptomyces antibioticus TaxID=1890 RepID=UPI0036FDE7C5